MYQFAFVSAAIGASLIWAGIKAYADGNLRDSRLMGALGLCGCGASAALATMPL